MIADGGTDQILLPIIRWSLHRIDPAVELLEPDFRKRVGSVADYLRSYESGAMLVFVHRDSENQTLDVRLREFADVHRDDVVPVIPVRMTEAWLLADARAIARAADAPDTEVVLPPISSLERISDPKLCLDELLLKAAGSPAGRRRKKFNNTLVERRINVASLVSDFSPLDRLASFSAFQTVLRVKYPYAL
ncbi:MAG: hypothetical protein R3B89_35615 [Polyangiaceae bacterium]|nr:hypothetical protein [Myxococcales bacterium]